MAVQQTSGRDPGRTARGRHRRTCAAGLALVAAGALICAAPAFSSPLTRAGQATAPESRANALYRLHLSLEEQEPPDAATVARELDACLELPTDATTARWCASTELIIRAELLSQARWSGDLASALGQRADLTSAAERLEALASNGLEQEERNAIARAGVVIVQLDLDLGRHELAGRGLADVRVAVGTDPLPAAYTLVANQYRILTGRYERVESLGQSARPAERNAAARHVLIARLVLARQRLRAGSSQAQERALLYRDARQYVAAPESSTSGALRIAVRAGRLALAAGDEEPGSELTQRALELLEELERASPQSLRFARAQIALLTAERLAGQDGDAARGRALEAIVRAWESQLEIWESSPLLAGGIGFLGDAERLELFCQALLAARRTRGDEGAFDLLMRTRCLGSIERSLGVAAPPAKSCRKWLADHKAGVLELVPGEELTLACAIDARGVRWFELEALPPLAPTILTLARILNDAAEGDAVPAQARKDLRAATTELGRALLPDELTRWLEAWEHVLIAGRELCFDADFEALPLGKAGPLGLARSVADVPSTALAHHLEMMPRDSDEKAGSLVVCATELEYSSPRTGVLQALPGSDELLGALRGADSSAEVLVGKNATLEALRARSGNAAERWTIFGHGANDVSRLVPAGILLASAQGEGRIAWWDDLAQLEVGRTCVLLTCKGSFGYGRAGDGGYSRLTGALMLAGAHTVLASPRDLEAADAARLHAAWLEELAAGRSPGVALRNAKAALARGPDEFPERWACLLRLHGSSWATGRGQ